MTALTATPSGYKLRPITSSPLTSYIYNSGDVYAIEASCTGSTCSPVQQVKVSIKESVRGTTSKYWDISMYHSLWSGPSVYVVSYNYECGVNIANKTDQTCSTWASDGAAGPQSGSNMINGKMLSLSFGSTSNVTKFPMVKLGVEFADGSYAIGDDGQQGEKFRGWDVCVTASTTKLCSSSGNGN